MRSDARPLVGLTVGDPAGIGPEIVRSVLGDRDLARELRLLVFGPASERPDDVPVLEDPARARTRADDALWFVTEGGDWEPGRVQASAGRAALAALRAAADLALARGVDALVTAPVSKEALHLAGERCEGQTELFGRWAGVPVEMLAIAGELRVLLLTRHLPLRRALDEITSERVFAHLLLLDAGLRALGFAAPRIACAGLNPHAGEGGILGTEELELLVPAIERARAAGLDVAGPESPDAVFLAASLGRYDGVLALYHDQAFLPIKLVAPRTGLTVLLGLPYLRVSPAHGTAFDLVGTGRADAGNLALALRRAAAWGPSYSPVVLSDASARRASAARSSPAG